MMKKAILVAQFQCPWNEKIGDRVYICNRFVEDRKKGILRECNRWGDTFPDYCPLETVEE